MAKSKVISNPQKGAFPMKKPTAPIIPVAPMKAPKKSKPMKKGK